ncbi:O-antigen ligase family protein [Mangrovimonas sp. AS39]|uniref:O-antigen ligase family protein n=1 Tax=Mangrovimonas futianensis TaxID=2895523 RepID=UPI001E45845E|nr:O-antigen ligase family protein [Mangrovimonas futianensis]MCF1193928.1 O-antigen ligase family protein [Mangrovimonas futianensis]
MEALNKLSISKETFSSILLFLSLWFFDSDKSVELKFIVLFFGAILLFFSRFRLHKETVNVIFPLICIFIVSLFSSIFTLPELYNFLKDTVHLTKPIFAIVFGIYIASHIKDNNTIIKVILLFCLFSALSHIFTVFYYLEEDWNTSTIRSIGGKGSDLEALGFSIYWVFVRKDNLKIFSSKFKIIFFWSLVISIGLYLSRTTFIAIIIFLITFYGLTQVNRKQVMYLLGVIILVISFMISLQFINIDRQASGIESFFYKIKIAPSEIFNAEIDVTDHTQLWDNWRAYEAKKAFETMEGQSSLIPYVAGMGLGSLVDLGFKAPLGHERMQFIPHVHNGYIYVFFKSGTIGLLLLLLWLYYLYTFIYRKSQSFEQVINHKIISGLGLYLSFSTLVITGVYNLGVTLSLLLGLSLGMLINLKEEINIR